MVSVDLATAVLQRKKLFHKPVSVTGKMTIHGFRCWIGQPKSGIDRDQDAIVIQCPGLACELEHTTGAAIRVPGGTIDEVTVTGTLKKSSLPEFKVMLSDVTSVIVDGYRGTKISVNLVDIDKDRKGEVKDGRRQSW